MALRRGAARDGTGWLGYRARARSGISRKPWPRHPGRRTCPLGISGLCADSLDVARLGGAKTAASFYLLAPAARSAAERRRRQSGMSRAARSCQSRLAATCAKIRAGRRTGAAWVNLTRRIQRRCCMTLIATRHCLAAVSLACGGSAIGAWACGGGGRLARNLPALLKQSPHYLQPHLRTLETTSPARAERFRRRRCGGADCTLLLLLLQRARISTGIAVISSCSHRHGEMADRGWARGLRMAGDISDADMDAKPCAATCTLWRT